MQTLSSFLMFGHIAAGSIVLLTMVISIVSKLADLSHAWHIRAGRLFTLGMTLIFVTGSVLSLLRNPINWFMLLVSVFSFYFAFMGLRYAKNRGGTPTAIDRGFVTLMLPVFVTFIAFGIYWMSLGEPYAIVALIFGIIGITNGLADRKHQLAGGLKGSERVAQHLARMLGGSIAAVTAFAVINVDLENPIVGLIAWLAPSIVLTPIMAIWEKKIRGGVRRKGMVA